MRIEGTVLDGVKLITYQVFGDARGSFMETYDTRAFAGLGIEMAFVQDSSSWSPEKGTVRGFHFQTPPHAQHKLVRVTRGRVFDVVVDLRSGTPDYGRHLAIELDAATPQALFVPTGCAHGFCTLSDDVEIAYKMSDHFTPDDYKGLLWCDPALGVDWPVSVNEAIVSDKDAAHPPLSDLPEYF